MFFLGVIKSCECVKAPFLISLFDVNLTLGVTVGSRARGEIVMEGRGDGFHPVIFPCSPLFSQLLGAPCPALLPLDGTLYSPRTLCVGTGGFT